MYTKTWSANEFTDDEVTVDTNNNLVLTKEVNTDCPKERIYTWKAFSLKIEFVFVKFFIKGEYDGKVVCLDIGLKLNFRCKYQLGEQLVSSQIDVSGHDDSFDAEGTGKIRL